MSPAVWDGIIGMKSTVSPFMLKVDAGLTGRGGVVVVDHHRNAGHVGRRRRRPSARRGGRTISERRFSCEKINAPCLAKNALAPVWSV